MGFGFFFFGWDTLLTCARALQCAITTWWVPGTQKCKFFENKWKLLGSGAFFSLAVMTPLRAPHGMVGAKKLVATHQVRTVFPFLGGSIY